jgi:hypothetical protein
MRLARDVKSGIEVKLLIGAKVMVGVPVVVPGLVVPAVVAVAEGVMEVVGASWAVETIARVARRRKVVTEEDLNIIFVCI